MTDAGRLVDVVVDGRSVAVPEGTNLVEAARHAGLHIPVFCHHPRLEPVGMCRMCLVELGTQARDPATGQIEEDEGGRPMVRYEAELVTACTTTARDGMVVRTDTPAVAEAQRGMIEFLLTSHPLDCPACDKGGECALQDLTMRYGGAISRFDWADKQRFAKPVPCGPLLVLDRERCVLCARCVRFQCEVAGDRVLALGNRGRGTEVFTSSDPPFASYFSGNTTDICPVGALTTRDFRFEARAWQVVSHPAICVHCAVGCNLVYDVYRGRIARVMPRENRSVNDIWICDKGRFAHGFAAAADRLKTPLVRSDGELVPATWDEALGQVVEGLRAIRQAHGPAAIGGLAGPGLANEDLYMFGRFLRAVVGTNNVDHTSSVVRDDIIHRHGCDDLARLADMGAGWAVLVVGLDVEEEAPVLGLHLHCAARQGASLLLLTGRPQKLDRHAESTLRYRYGAEGDTLAELVHAVAEATGLASAFGRAPQARGQPTESTDALRHQEDALRAAALAIAASRHLVVLYGLEAARAAMAPGLGALSRLLAKAGGPSCGLVAVGRHANTQGAADMGVLPNWLPGYERVTDHAARAALGEIWPALPTGVPGLDAPAMLDGGVRALLLLGTDPAGDSARLAARMEDLELLVVHELYPTESARRAHVVLPSQSPAEADGTFTNFLRRVQRFSAAVPPVGQARPGWLVIRDLGQRFGAAEPFSSPADVFAEITRAAPPYGGLAYADLGPDSPTSPSHFVKAAAPGSRPREVWYEGTRYGAADTEGVSWPVQRDDDGPIDWRPEPASVEDALVLVPIRRLYAGDRLADAPLLAPLRPRPHVVMHPDEAEALGLEAGARIRLVTDHGSTTAELRTDRGASRGVVLAPEQLAWDAPLLELLDGAARAPVRVEPE